MRDALAGLGLGGQYAGGGLPINRLFGRLRETPRELPIGNGLRLIQKGQKSVDPSIDQSYLPPNISPCGLPCVISS